MASRSSFLHNHVKAGDVLEVSAPRGTFTLRPATDLLSC